MSTPMKVTADVLQDFLEGKLSVDERRRVSQVIRDDKEVAQRFEMMRASAEILRANLELEQDIPAEWWAIISRWKPQR